MAKYWAGFAFPYKSMRVQNLLNAGQKEINYSSNALAQSLLTQALKLDIHFLKFDRFQMNWLKFS